MPSRTPLTPARRALLGWLLETCRYCAGDPRRAGPALRTDPRVREALDTCAPKRKPAFDDTVGQALWNTRAWLAGTFDPPMSATVRLIANALGEPVPPPYADPRYPYDVLVVPCAES